MPSRSITASKIRTDADIYDENQTKLIKKGQRNWFLIWIYAILAVFVINVAGQCIYNNWSKSITEDKEENVCLSYFIKEKCDLTNLNDRCIQLMNCFKGDKEGTVETILSNVDMIVDEVLENIPVPGIIVVVLAVIKYFQKEQQKEE